MPWIMVWQDPELVVEHNGVTVWRAYKDGYRAMDYWYSLDADITEIDMPTSRNVFFDVRDLPGYDAARPHADIIVEAIDNGILTQDGVQCAV